MDWTEYAEWTGTTALESAANPEYLKLGAIEEAFEALEAYCAMQAARYGKQKRILRGDGPEVLAAKDAAVERAKLKLREEVGDLAWYVARILAGTPQVPDFDGEWKLEFTLSAAEDVGTITTHDTAQRILAELLAFTDAPLEAILEGNKLKLEARKAASLLRGEGDR
jgi:NTP pyrophosphatase (non-canonical NTP hydrolase)